MSSPPTSSVPRARILHRATLLFWVLALIAIPIWAHFAEPVIGWDLQVYRNAIHAMSLGHDPYLDGIAVQRAFHATFSSHPDAIPPYTYVYSPLTLPALRWLGNLPTAITGTLYWLLLVAGFCITIYAGFWCATPREKPFFALVTPLAIFFNGLLLFDVVFSGNVAFILYGLIFLASLIGWRTGRWAWFYPAVLLASLCKAPMLSLLAVPVLSARRQWIPVAATGAIGVFAFAMQPHVWPQLFSHYLQAVELQFSFNKDFGISVAGVLARALYDHMPYQQASAVFYALTVLCVGPVLLLLSRKFLAGALSQKEWMPVMMLGVILLNPRIMEYDIAPITLMMALVLWRLCTLSGSITRSALCCALFLAVANFLATKVWRTTECVVLVALFFSGSLQLYFSARRSSATTPGVHATSAGHPV